MSKYDTPKRLQGLHKGIVRRILFLEKRIQTIINFEKEYVTSHKGTILELKKLKKELKEVLEWVNIQYLMSRKMLL